MASKPGRIAVQRLDSGFYRAQGDGPCEWAQWDPKAGLTDADFFPEASEAFRRKLRKLDLGLACASCGWLEVEHHIDGLERAPCNEYVAAVR